MHIPVPLEEGFLIQNLSNLCKQWLNRSDCVVPKSTAGEEQVVLEYLSISILNMLCL